MRKDEPLNMYPSIKKAQRLFNWKPKFSIQKGLKKTDLFPAIMWPNIIFGGSIGNLFDRIYYSAVPDFIDISYKGYHWFIFNVADIFISVGIICLIFVELMNYKKSDEN